MRELRLQHYAVVRWGGGVGGVKAVIQTSGQEGDSPVPRDGNGEGPRLFSRVTASSCSEIPVRSIPWDRRLLGSGPNGYQFLRLLYG